MTITHEEILYLDQTVQNLKNTMYQDVRKTYDMALDITELVKMHLNDKSIDNPTKKKLCFIGGDAYALLIRILSDYFRDEEAAKKAYLYLSYLWEKIETYTIEEEF
jgi:hypothetical protein